jgi:hypothetical protein
VIPLAHAGDLIVDLPLFGGPVLVLAGWLIVNRMRDRRTAEPVRSTDDRR